MDLAGNMELCGTMKYVILTNYYLPRAPWKYIFCGYVEYELGTLELKLSLINMIIKSI